MELSYFLIFLLPWILIYSIIVHADNISEVLDEEDFNTLVEIHEARQNNDFETAKGLRSDLGLAMPRFGNMRMGRI